jgi:hypothetical protein
MIGLCGLHVFKNLKFNLDKISLHRVELGLKGAD